jgi:murein L,D-transpeptidase YcbB/YkuD
MLYFFRAMLLILLTCSYSAQGWTQETPTSNFLRQSLQPQLQKSSDLTVKVADVPAAVAQFYAERDWAPIWDNARFTVLIQQIESLEYDGLNPEDYNLTTLKTLQTVDADPKRQAQREELATRSYLLALVHLYHGKVDPVKLDAHWNFDMSEIDPEFGLKLAGEAVEQNKIPDIFQRARPSLPHYDVLKNILVNLRKVEKNGGWPIIPTGSSLKLGMQDSRVPILRKRLQAAGLLPEESNKSLSVYDKATVQAVQRFQKGSYQDADGIVGPGTLSKLNTSIEQRIDQVRANLERMRWFHNEYKNDFVLVDLAGYRIYYMHDGKPIWKSRVQIGKAYRQTPIFKSEINYITLNPTWTVPPTIFKEDSLPAIRRSLSYLSRNHIRVLDSKGKEISPTSVNWSHPGNIMLRQDAGSANSLGQLVIRFPNSYSVYMHDTPHQAMFEANQRAFSSGCIRVERVHELVVLLFNDPQKWNRSALETALSTNKTRNVTLSKKVPVMLAYWTVDIGDDGSVSYKPDVYKRDAILIKALDNHQTLIHQTLLS